MKIVNKKIVICAISLQIFSSFAFAQTETKTMQFIQVKKATNKSILPFNRDFFVEMHRLFNTEVFVETGTYLGDTSEIAATVFKEVRTVELSAELCELARKRFVQNPNIFLYQGDSGYALHQMLSHIKTDARALILLDSHWSGGNTARGMDVPILRELESIKRSGVKNSVILIDDIRCFQNQPLESKDPYPYPDLSIVIQRIKEIDTNYTCIVYGDVLLAYTDSTIEVPALLQAITTSRINQADHGTLSKAETTIASASDEDTYHLSQLASLLDVSTGNWRVHYYDFWYALTLHKRGNKSAALQYMKHAANLGFARAKYYLELWK